MAREISTPGVSIDLGLDPRDPWAVIPPQEKAKLQESLAEMARVRRVAFDSLRNLPLP